MKLAEALQERADLNKKIAQLRSRLVMNATVQEGEKTAENPQELLKELNSCLENLQSLIGAINITNCKTIVKGKSLTELIANKDCLTLKIQSYRELLDAASRLAQRATRTEIKIESAIDVQKYQNELDQMSKELRILDNTIQELNWTTLLITQ
ncbi:MAG: DIP1984 family protein [Paludibacteraceae bacterium]|jgi:hypothetical protein|nr:DIP1984 family protein [Paludibacteraceae bacterium]